MSKTTFIIWSAMVCLGRTYQFKFFKGCLPQIFTWSILEYLDPNNVWKVIIQDAKATFLKSLVFFFTDWRIYFDLIHFMVLVFFYTPPPLEKHQKTSGFLLFCEGIEKDQPFKYVNNKEKQRKSLMEPVVLNW